MADLCKRMPIYDVFFIVIEEIRFCFTHFFVKLSKRGGGGNPPIVGLAFLPQKAGYGEIIDRAAG